MGGLVGNSYATEASIGAALVRAGHDVRSYAEQDPMEWVRAIQDVQRGRNGPDQLWWTWAPTRTASVEEHLQLQLLDAAREAGVSTISVHIDRWWGLSRRQHLAADRAPFFRTDLLATADHGHGLWEEHGIAHVWFPPAMPTEQVMPSCRGWQQDTRLVFTGQWRNYPHPEWASYRRALVEAVRREFPFMIVQERGVYGQALTNLYAGSVVLGDACLPPLPDGSPMTHYTSDRPYEVIGRGGLIVHPNVPYAMDVWQGLDAVPPLLNDPGPLLVEGEHFLGYELGNINSALEAVGFALRTNTRRRQIIRDGMEWVLGGHTYDHRVANLLEQIESLGL